MNSPQDELNFQQLFESCPEMYLILRPDSPRFTIIAANNAYLRATMSRRQDLVHKSVFEAFPDNPADPMATGVRNLRDSLERVLKYKKADVMPVQKYDIRRPASQGGEFEVRYWNPINSPVLDADGEVLMIIHCVEDMTKFLKLSREDIEAELTNRNQQLQATNEDLRRTEESVRASRDRFLSILDTAYDSFVGIDDLGRITDWNLQAEKTFGWTKEEVLGHPLHDVLIPTRFRESHLHGLKRFSVSGVGPVLGKRLELAACRKEGGEIPVELTISAIPQGSGYFFGAFLKDISEIKRAERFAEMQLEVTRGLVESSTLEEAFARSLEIICKKIPSEWGALWTFDTDHEQLILAQDYSLPDAKLEEFVEVSRKMAFSIGTGLPGRVWKSGQPSWTVDLMLDMNFPRHREAIKCGLRGGAAIPVYVGSELYGVMEFVSRKMQTTDQKFLEVMTDIATRLGYYVQRTEREELIQAKLAAEEANNAKSTFLANMSHEIRTPLGVVLGFSELLMSPETTNEEKAVCMATIKRNGELLSSIINDILDLSKVETGKLDIERRTVAIEEVLSDISSHLSLKAQEKGIDYHVQMEGVVPRMIQTDPIRLRQILINIIGNAIKFTEKGSIQVTLKQVSPPGARLRLAFIVKDTGRGISFSQREKLFQPFSQADASTTRKFGGTGLGLILSKRMARLLGGDVILSESRPGLGSTFVVTIESLEEAPQTQELPMTADL